MIDNNEIRKLVDELYPAKTHRKSCFLCAEALGYSSEFIYKTCSKNSNYPVRKSLYITLQTKKVLKLYKIKNKEVDKINLFKIYNCINNELNKLAEIHEELEKLEGIHEDLNKETKLFEIDYELKKESGKLDITD